MRYCLFFFLLVVVAGCKQKEQPKDDSSSSTDLQLKVYRQAMDVGDLNTAIVAMQTLWAQDSASNYRDTLAMLYFEDGKYPQAAQLAANVLRNDTSNRKYMEILARSLQAGGKIPEAEGYYERLRQITGDPTYDYQSAVINFNSSKTDRALLFVNKLLNTPQIDTAHIKLFTSEGIGQTVPLKAAAFNLLGSIEVKQKKLAEARQSYGQALKLDSSFTIAKNNLKAVGK